MLIQRLSADIAAAAVPALADLLQNAVAGGASIGFLPPLSDREATDYWYEVVDALRTPYRILLVAQIDQATVGTVQLDLASRPNGRHRAEVAKLMVHTAHR